MANTLNPTIAIMDDEKTAASDMETKARALATPTVEEVSSQDGISLDGDDALKLAGTNAHHFDEKYYLRLRRKIVSLRRDERHFTHAEFQI
jgi:MFS transporter, ACS family, allantoate permease